MLKRRIPTCTPTNPDLNSENRSSGLETGQGKITAIADHELHNLILNYNNNNNVFISYIKYTNITPPANSKANRGRWRVDGLRFIT